MSRHRIAVELSDEQYEKFVRLIPYGAMSEIYSIITDDLLGLLDTATPKERQMILGAVSMHKLGLREYSQLFSQFSKKKARKSHGKS